MEGEAKDSHKNPFVINLILECFFFLSRNTLAILAMAEAKRRAKKERCDDACNVYRRVFNFQLFFSLKLERFFFSFKLLYISFDLINLGSEKETRIDSTPKNRASLLPIATPLQPSSRCAS